jgi:hypothetical protein
MQEQGVYRVIRVVEADFCQGLVCCVELVAGFIGEEREGRGSAKGKEREVGEEKYL